MSGLGSRSNGLSLFSKCCNPQKSHSLTSLSPPLLPKLCDCGPSATPNMCQQAQKWLLHVHDMGTKPLVETYRQVIPSQSLLDSDEVAVVIHKHCRYKFSALRKTRQQQDSLQRILRRLAGQLKLKKVQSYMQVYGWLGAQLLFHAGQAGAFFILRHLIYKMQLYDQSVFQTNQQLAVDKMMYFIPQALQILKMYNIDIKEIIQFHSNSLFAQSVEEKFMGWLITEYLAHGWPVFVNVMCSYVDQRLQSNRAESRQEFYKMFFSETRTEWPWVFCGIQLFQ